MVTAHSGHLQSRSSTHETSGLPFQRLAGLAGLSVIAVGVTQMVVVGNTHVLGASAKEVAAFFAANGSANRIGVVLSAVLGVPIAIYMVGIHRTISAAGRVADSSWSTVFGVLAVIDMVSITTSGIFANLAFLVGVIAWIAVSSVLMLRDK